jgi:hypothetical protein
MFAIWFIATLAYLNYQARRVTLDKLYVQEYNWNQPNADIIPDIY